MADVKPVEIDSRIAGVTVFADRALVTRTARTRLGAGEHRLLFPNLPENL